MEALSDRDSTVSLSISRIENSKNQIHFLNETDLLAVEEPLEIRLEYGPEAKRIRKSISITMRTPGNDFELAVGFLFTEGILRERSQLRSVQFCGPSRNVVRVEIEPGVEFDLKKLERHFYTSSSCGVCGKASIEALRVQSAYTLQSSEKLHDLVVNQAVIHELPKKLRLRQGVFDSTGGLHACAFFDSAGNLLEVREDVGRHNALDKLIGHYFLKELIPLRAAILLVSGRASFELVQKATMAGIQIFAAVGAPSSLAVELAKDSNMTLLGFVREQRFNIYHGSERIRL